MPVVDPAAARACHEVGTVSILLATYDWADEQFRCVDLDPAAAKFIAAKNPMNYHLAYSPLAAAT